jgi:hypothetical protein
MMAPFRSRNGLSALAAEGALERDRRDDEADRDGVWS